MKVFEQNLIFNLKTAATLIAVCVLFSVFIAIPKANALYPPLEITKNVDKTFLELGEEITYTLNYRNNTSNELTGVVIKDPLTQQNQNYLTFVSASPSPTSGNDTWNIGSLGPNQSGQITIRAKVSESIPGWASEIKNKATIDSDQTFLRYSNNASVFITVRDYTPKTNTFYTGGTLSSYDSLTIDKSVRNITKGSGYTYWTNWVNTLYAEPGDELEFLIKIKAPRDKDIDSIRVSDDLPPKLIYISDSTMVDGYYEPDGIISKNIYIGDAYSYLGREITFKARVVSSSSFKTYPITIVNKAYAWGSDGKKVEGTAKIIIREPNSISTTGSTISSGTGRPWNYGLIGADTTYATDTDEGSEEQDLTNTDEESEENEKQEVLGAEDVQVGINLFGLILLSIFSAIVAFILYCRIREDKLPKFLAKPYFRLKLSWALTKARFR